MRYSIIEIQRSGKTDIRIIENPPVLLSEKVSAMADEIENLTRKLDDKEFKESYSRLLDFYSEVVKTEVKNPLPPDFFIDGIMSDEYAAEMLRSESAFNLPIEDLLDYLVLIA